MYTYVIMNQLPIQIAHRGNSLLCGDNNMRSFISAVENGFDMIELDIHLCKTGEIVIFHDLYIANEFISNMTLDEVKEHDILTLDEFFNTINVLYIDIFLDLKGTSSIIQSLIDMLQRRFTHEEMKKIYISSFNRKFTKVLAHSLLPVNIGFTTDNKFTLEELEVVTKYIDFACFHWSILDETAISMLHEKDIRVFTFTCENDIIQRRMMTHDIDGIVTNYPLFQTLALKS